MQLRSAKKFGFDFEKHNNDKVGVIRSFVRKKKEEERKRLIQPAEKIVDAEEGTSPTPQTRPSSAKQIPVKNSAVEKKAPGVKTRVTTRSKAAEPVRPVRNCRKNSAFKPKAKSGESAVKVAAAQAKKWKRNMVPPLTLPRSAEMYQGA